MVQWLGLGAFTAGAPGSIPDWGTKIPQGAWHEQKKKEKRKSSLWVWWKSKRIGDSCSVSWLIGLSVV